MRFRPGVVVLVVIVLTTSPVLGATGGPMAESTVAASSDDIVRTMTFSLTPDKPGSVRVTVSYSLPNTVESLNTTVPERVLMKRSEGFTEANTGTYEWDGSTQSPILRFDMPANRTGSYHLAPSEMPTQGPQKSVMNQQVNEGLVSVDAGSWAIVTIPPLSTRWTYRGSPAPSFVREVRTDGPGVPGDQLVYLGPHEKTTRTIDDGEVSLIVPAEADLAPTPKAILDSIDSAAYALQVGPHPDRVVLIAAPTTVDWGPYGLTKRPDAWVRADESLSNPDNVWLHEYVHLRQNFTTSSDAQWVLEAMPTYYAASLTLEQGRIDFPTFQDRLARGERSRYQSSILTQPDSWGSLANYVKGGLVFGNLDRRLRLKTERRHAATDLFRAMNRRSEPVTHEFIHNEISRIGDDQTASWYKRQTTESGTGEMWTRTDHAAAFNPLPSEMIVSIADQHSVSGPYRNGSSDSVPVIAPGETVTFRGNVSNVGDETGTYTVSLVIDGTERATRTGSLEGREQTTVTFEHTFQEPGEKRVSIGKWSQTVSVQSPASPRASDISIPSSSIEPGTATVTVTVENPTDRPADGDLRLAVDGNSVETWTEQLEPGETVTRSIELELTDSGTHEVTVNGLSREITVRDTTSETSSTMPTGDEGTATDIQETTQTGVPGIGPEGVVGTILAFALFASKRWD